MQTAVRNVRERSILCEQTSCQPIRRHHLRYGPGIMDQKKYIYGYCTVFGNQ
jgi:hypothetical protein